MDIGKESKNMKKCQMEIRKKAWERQGIKLQEKKKKKKEKGLVESQYSLEVGEEFRCNCFGTKEHYSTLPGANEVRNL